MAAPNSQIFPAQDNQADAVTQEPSMEDILASIRRIIASDQHVASARTVPAAARSGAESGFSASSEPEAVPEVPADAEPGRQSVPQFPGLEDLEPLDPPPPPLETDSVGAGHSPAATSGTETLSALQEQLYTHAEPDASPATDEDVYDLSLDDRLTGEESEPLISSSAGAAVSSSFQALANTVLLRDPEMLERIARDTLRPLLKSWLDENLPSMVERLVRTEIERVARGGR